MVKEDQQISDGEFVAIAALLMSLVAMAIDAMLPALGVMATDLGLEDSNNAQLVVSSIFAGLALGQVFFGPLSDSRGRRWSILLGVGIFCVGGVISLAAQSFEVLLIGRCLQGIGAAGPRIVTVAMVRDRFSGAGMARIMSMIMAVFIVVPALAPVIGQLILWGFHWRAIFLALLIQAIAGGVWLWLRQPETLRPENKKTLHVKTIAQGAGETLRNRISLSFTVAAGFVSGAFIAYLSTSQQLFQGLYGVGKLFPLYFALLALAIGCAALVNSRLVARLGMYLLSLRAVWGIFLFSLLYLPVAQYFSGKPPLWSLLLFFACVFFCVGILFGNLNALALEPLPHIAGTAAAVVASLSTVISVAIGVLVGRMWNSSVTPLVVSFAVLGALTLPTMWLSGARKSTDAK